MLKLTKNRKKPIPRIYYNWENIEINEISFLLTKKIQSILCICDLTLRNYHPCTNCMPKRLVTENEVCDYHMTKVIMACVSICLCMSFMASPACLLIFIYIFIIFIVIFTHFQFSLIHKQIYIKIPLSSLTVLYEATITCGRVIRMMLFQRKCWCKVIVKTTFYPVEISKMDINFKVLSKMNLSINGCQQSFLLPKITVHSLLPPPSSPG